MVGYSIMKLLHMIKPKLSAMALFAVLTGAANAASLELTLRPHCAPEGPVVRLSDVADVNSLDNAVRDPLLGVQLMPTPAPGMQQRLTAAQVRDMLAANGIDVANLRFVGVDAVAVNGPALAPRKAAPAQKPLRQLTRDAAAEQVVAEITGFLRQQTGHDLWNVTVEPNAALVEAVRIAPARPSLGGGRAPWTGRQRFTFSWEANSPGLAAVVQVERLETAACAVRSIERGDLIRATDVVLRPISGVDASKIVGSLDAVVGKEALQAIRADSVIQATQIRSPLIVRRGERVTVKARAAGVVVRTYATAREDGSLGDLIMVEALEGREKYAARVSGARELEVFAAGAVASEISATIR